jgi:hypothetical protein
VGSPLLELRHAVARGSCSNDSGYGYQGTTRYSIFSIRRIIKGMRFFNFNRKEQPQVKRSSMTISECISSAREAGRKTPDTGLFEEWLRTKGLSTRGNVLVARMRREYEGGFEERFQAAAPDSRELNRQFLKRAAAFPDNYKGFRISQENDSWKYSGDAESLFDTWKDLKRFIDSL